MIETFQIAPLSTEDLIDLDAIIGRLNRPTADQGGTRKRLWIELSNRAQYSGDIVALLWDANLNGVFGIDARDWRVT